MRTRQPTGAANWPMLLVEGREGARKTSEALRLSSDPRIGATYVIEVGERRVDEYATLGTFEVVEHDDTLRTIVPAIYDVMHQPPVGGLPTLLVIDSGTALWDKVKREAERIARSSKSAVQKLAADEYAEIEVGHQAWNRAKDPWWWGWLNDLRAWPGVFVMTARADEVSKFVDGRPVANQTDYRIDIERGTPFIFDATIRMRGAAAALVTTAKSLNFTVPQDGLALPLELPLAHAVFELFKAGTDIKLTVPQAKTSLVAVARSLGHDEDGAKAAAGAAWRVAGNRSSFDHVAMSELVALLEPPDTPSPDVDPKPDVTPDADVPALPAELPAERPDDVDSTVDPSNQHSATEGPSRELTADGDAQAWEHASTELAAAVIARVTAMSTTYVDDQLKEFGLPLTGNVQTRRARLAHRLVHLDLLAQLEPAAS